MTEVRLGCAHVVWKKKLGIKLFSSWVVVFVSDSLNLIVRGGSAVSLARFGYVSEQISSHSVQVGENLYALTSRNEELVSVLHRANDEMQQDCPPRSTCTD